MKPVVAEGHNFAVASSQHSANTLREENLRNEAKGSVPCKNLVSKQMKKRTALGKNTKLAFLLNNIVDPSDFLKCCKHFPFTVKGEKCNSTHRNWSLWTGHKTLLASALFVANPCARRQLLDSSQFQKTGILRDAEAVGITLAAGTVTAAEARTAQVSRDCVWSKIQELLA